ncbi:MAG: hypothetical protein ACYCU0_04865 [Solirubrobacteraceae bacterium]
MITVSKGRLRHRRGQLDPTTIRRLNAALVLALGLDQWVRSPVGQQRP